MQQRISDVNGIYDKSPVCAYDGADVDSLENGECQSCEKFYCDQHILTCLVCGTTVCVHCVAEMKWSGLICGDCLDEPEPDCECRRVAVDVDDQRGCPLHNQHSKWNRRRKAIEERTEAA